MEPQKQTLVQKAEVKLQKAAKGMIIPYNSIEYKLDRITLNLKEKIEEADCSIQFNGNAEVIQKMKSGDELHRNADVTGKIKIKDYEFAKIESIEIISII